MVKNVNAVINTITDMMLYLGHLSNRLKGSEKDKKLIIETFLGMIIHLIEIIEIPSNKLALAMMDKAKEHIKDTSAIDKLQAIIDGDDDNNGEIHGDA